MCGTCRPALGPLCMTHREGGAGGERGEGDGNTGNQLLSIYARKEED